MRTTWNNSSRYFVRYCISAISSFPHPHVALGNEPKENPCVISTINAQLNNWIIIQSNLSRCFLNVHSFVVAVVEWNNHYDIDWTCIEIIHIYSFDCIPNDKLLLGSIEASLWSRFSVLMWIESLIRKLSKSICRIRAQRSPMLLSWRNRREERIFMRFFLSQDKKWHRKLHALPL